MKYENHVMVRLVAVRERTGYSRATVYLCIRQGLWPTQRPIPHGMLNRLAFVYTSR